MERTGAISAELCPVLPDVVGGVRREDTRDTGGVRRASARLVGDTRRTDSHTAARDRREGSRNPYY